MSEKILIDRELLELAAKAAGAMVEFTNDQSVPFIDGDVTHPAWSPLDDDGDALRLAVKLGLMVDIQNSVRVTNVWTTDASGAADVDVAHFDDPYAATRRAIVRAAAEIGRNMK